MSEFDKATARWSVAKRRLKRAEERLKVSHPNTGQWRTLQEREYRDAQRSYEEACEARASARGR